MPSHALVSRLQEWIARLREPTVQTDLLQVVKASLATVLAWIFAARLLGLEQSFLAPWVALLTVHATVYRSVLRGGQSVVATLLGVLLAYGIVETLGYGALSLGLGVFVGLLVARWRHLRLEGVAIATTAVFLLTIGGTQEEALLVDRLLATLVGVVSGVVVNLLIVPPLDDRAAEGQLDVIHRRLGALLRRMARRARRGRRRRRACGTGSRRPVGIDAEVDRAEWLLDYSRESQWWNPRRKHSVRAGDPDHGSEVLVAPRGGGGPGARHRPHPGGVGGARRRVGRPLPRALPRAAGPRRAPGGRPGHRRRRAARGDRRARPRAVRPRTCPGCAGRSTAR